MHSRNFLVASSRSSMYSTISSVNSDSLIPSFPIWVPFISFSSLRVDILVFFLILEEMFSAFTIEHDVSCKFVTYGLYYIEVCSLYAYFLEGFIINVLWILSKAFYVSIEMYIFYSSVCWCCVSHWLIWKYWKILAYLGWILWSWCMVFLNVLLDSNCLYFVEDFCIYVDQWYWPVIFFLSFFFFFVVSLSGVGIRVIVAR